MFKFSILWFSIGFDIIYKMKKISRMLKFAVVSLYHSTKNVLTKISVMDLVSKTTKITLIS